VCQRRSNLDGDAGQYAGLAPKLRKCLDAVMRQSLITTYFFQELQRLSKEDYLNAPRTQM
jgi:hypothetical protein